MAYTDSLTTTTTDVAADPADDWPVLLVDDEPAWLQSFSLTLRGAGLGKVLTCEDSRRVLPLLARQPVGVVVLDLTMPHISGEELLHQLVQEYPTTPVIIVTALDLVDTAVNCMKLGAFDYFTKVSEQERLIAGIRRALDMGRLRRENERLRENFFREGLAHPEAFTAIITTDPAMRTVFKYMEAVAGTTEPVMIFGETGVGKELAARAIHTLSGRPGRFVPVNIAGLDDQMLADTLFGHAKGAFTGADQARAGLVEQAAGGTLFLDEIGDLSPHAQIKLLRLLQEREYLPLGSDLPKRAACRVVVATHHDLSALRQSGSFRKDLFYRLHAHHLRLPPLRERLENDLPLLLDFFLQQAATQLGKKAPAWPEELLNLLGNYAFPGNIRELRNIVFDAMSKQQGRMLSLTPFVDYLRQNETELAEPWSLQAPSPASSPAGADAVSQVAPPTNPFQPMNMLPTLKEAGRLLVAEAMRRANSNQVVAAGMLGITRQALNRRLKQDAE